MGGFLSGMIGAGASLASRRAWAPGTLNTMKRPGDDPYLDPGEPVMLDDSGTMVSPFALPPPVDPKIAELQKRKVIRADAPPPPMQVQTPPPDPYPIPLPADPFGMNYDVDDPRDIAPPILAAMRTPTPAIGPAGAVQALAETAPQAPKEPGEKQKAAPDVFLDRDLDDDWRYGAMNLPRPHTVPDDSVGALQETGPVQTTARGGNEEAPRVTASVGGRVFDYTNSERIPLEARIGGGRGNVSQLRVQGNPFAPEPDPELQTRVQARSREALLRGLDDPYYLEDERYRRRKEIDEQYRTRDKDEAQKEARQLLSEYESDVRAMQAEGGDDLEERVRNATDMLNRELAVLGIRPHVPPRRW